MSAPAVTPDPIIHDDRRAREAATAYVERAWATLAPGDRDRAVRAYADRLRSHAHMAATEADRSMMRAVRLHILKVHTARNREALR